MKRSVKRFHPVMNSFAILSLFKLRKITHLESSITRGNKLNIIRKLELISRLLDNDELSTEQVNDIKDFLDDYVERNQKAFDKFDDVDMMLYSTLPVGMDESFEDVVTVGPPDLVKGIVATGVPKALVARWKSLQQHVQKIQTRAENVPVKEETYWQSLEQHLQQVQQHNSQSSAASPHGAGLITATSEDQRSSSVHSQSSQHTLTGKQDKSPKLIDEDGKKGKKKKVKGRSWWVPFVWCSSSKCC